MHIETAKPCGVTACEYQYRDFYFAFPLHSNLHGILKNQPMSFLAIPGVTPGIARISFSPFP